MIAISNLKLAPGADEAQLRVLAARALNASPACASAKSRSMRAEKTTFTMFTPWA